jgi:hypothetical protein
MVKVILSPMVEKMSGELFFEQVSPYLTLGDLQSYMVSHRTDFSKPEFLKAKIEERGWANEKNLREYKRLEGAALRSEKVVKLDLTGSDLEDEELAGIAMSFPRLEKINLARCHKITGKGLAALAKHCPLLKALDCAGCLGIKDFGGAVFANMKVLMLAHILGMKDPALKELLSGCPLVEELDISGNHQLQGVGIFDFCGNVTRLNACGSVWLRDAHLEEIAQKCGRLNWISVCGSEGVTQVGLRYLTHVQKPPVVEPETMYVEPPSILMRFLIWLGIL